jgi:hypothetical protein
MIGTVSIRGRTTYSVLLLNVRYDRLLTYVVEKGVTSGRDGILERVTRVIENC